MKAIIFHATECAPEDFWYPWLKTELQKQGYDVEVPHYVDINRTPIKDFLPKVLAAHEFDEDTVLIGHSAGGPLILSILENIDAQIAKAVLVAGFSETLGGDGGLDVILQDSYEWKKIRQHSKEFIFFNSANDPWGCDDKQGKRMFDNLGGTLIIRNDGHFGSATMKQPYKEFPLLKALVLGEAK